jgi:hypothetical protein
MRELGPVLRLLRLIILLLLAAAVVVLGMVAVVARVVCGLQLHCLYPPELHILLLLAQVAAQIAAAEIVFFLALQPLEEEAGGRMAVAEMAVPVVRVVAVVTAPEVSVVLVAPAYQDKVTTAVAATATEVAVAAGLGLLVVLIKIKAELVMGALASKIVTVGLIHITLAGAAVGHITAALGDWAVAVMVGFPQPQQVRQTPVAAVGALIMLLLPAVLGSLLFAIPMRLVMQQQQLGLQL